MVKNIEIEFIRIPFLDRDESVISESQLGEQLNTFLREKNLSLDDIIITHAFLPQVTALSVTTHGEHLYTIFYERKSEALTKKNSTKYKVLQIFLKFAKFIYQ